MRWRAICERRFERVIGDRTGFVPLDSNTDQPLDGPPGPAVSPIAEQPPLRRPSRASGRNVFGRIPLLQQKGRLPEGGLEAQQDQLLTLLRSLSSAALTERRYAVLQPEAECRLKEIATTQPGGRATAAGPFKGRAEVRTIPD